MFPAARQRDWTADRNGDGYPDDVTLRLALDAQTAVPRALLAALLDICARAGLGVHALALPLVVVGDADPSAVRLRTIEDIPTASDDFSRPLAQPPAPSSPDDCLTKLFSAGGLLEDRDGDLLPDATRVTFQLPDELPPELAAALGNLAARIGLESGGVSFPLVDEGGEGGARFRVEPGAGAAHLSANTDGWHASGASAELALLIECVAANWPHITAPETGGASAGLDWLRRALAGDGPEAPTPGATLWELQWSARWEVDALLDAFRLDLLPSLAPGAPLQLTVFASEPPDVRKRLSATLRAELRAAGHDGDVVVLRAFKAGLAWLQDVVTPACQALPVARLRITYQRYDGGENSLDLPIRWLQELFPGVELVAAALGLPQEAIEVDEASAVGQIWAAEAFDADGATLGEWSCSPLSHTQPFIALVPEAGHVRVTTGGLVARQGERVWSVPVATDLERFWSFWQGEVLPRLAAEIARGGGARADLQPFFGALDVEVWVSEPNQTLGVREENDSAAEALHEEIYFGTLDAIALLGQRHAGERTNAPGAIVPVVRVMSGVAPHARVRLRAAPARPRLPFPRLRATTLELRDDAFLLGIIGEIDDASDATLARLRELAAAAQPADGLAAQVTLDGETLELRLPLPRLLAATHGDVPPLDRNIWGDEVLAQASALARFPEVTAWVEDYSYEGRPIPALALGTPTPGRLASPTKAAIFKPTYFVIARHHANEISSTNAAFRLAWLCATDPDWRTMLERVNIVILPYENPDGAALHARLTSDPNAHTWKHHPARYNALGFEYGEEHFDPETRFGEARARTQLWRRWPADLVVDNHGVPSHEWLQPFAGFGSPPRFRVSYWVPQALLYGIAQVVLDPRYPELRDSVEALRDAVSARVRDTDIGDWNRVYGASYRFWGQSREPEHFPGVFHDDMLWHISEAAADPAGRSFDIRHPATTPIVWVTEVNDETAEGEHLERVARAHLLANEATLRLLASSAPALQRWRSDDGHGRHTLRIGRERPLRLGGQRDADADVSGG